MNHYCIEDLPEEFHGKIVLPVRTERHVDHSAHASKVLGYDGDERRCFYQHVFTLTEERFDAEEFPVEVSVYHEHVLGWRLLDGRWLKLKVWADRLDHCRKRVVVQPPEIIEETALGH
jgi:hypothetical protein